MPHMNRIRINNVKYNFGTQFYDDFMMRFSGKNAIYDLANGGGKSVLLLLLLQNLIPNCTLDEKQPIEKLFRSGNDNTVIHSLIEWKLNACDIKNGFQYMTTGFCARKARDSEQEERSGETAGIEYFNYCIFYREFQDHDIRNLPLCDGKERITFQGLRSYLRELGKKDYSVQVHIFDRKGDYQRFISGYGLYESEWEIIRGINKTEGHVRTYFETNYKTTRKVVEDLFIEEIIEKSFRNQMQGAEGGTEIAKTLLDIKDKLAELAQKKGEISHYDRQLEALESFCVRLSGLESIYGRKEELERKLVSTYYTARNRQQDRERKLEEAKRANRAMSGQKEELAKNLANAEIVLEEQALDAITDRMKQLRLEYGTREEVCRLKEKSLDGKEGANDYLDYLENRQQLEIQNQALYSISDNSGDLLEELCTLAFNRRRLMDQEYRDIEEQRVQLSEELEMQRKQLEALDKEERHAENQAAVLESQEKRLSQQVEQQGARLEELRSASGLLLLENSVKEQKRAQRQYQELSDRGEQVRQQLREQELAYEKQRWDQEQLRPLLDAAQERYESAREEAVQFEEGEDKLTHMEEIYGEKGAKALLECVQKAFQSLGVQAQALKDSLERKRELLGTGDSEVPVIQNGVLKELFAYVRRHYDPSAIYGRDYLKEKNEEERRLLLAHVPYLPYALVVSSHFLDLSIDTKLQKMRYEGQIVPFVERSFLENGGIVQEEGQVFFAVQDNAVFYDREQFEEEITRIKKEIADEERQLVRTEENAQVLLEDSTFLNACIFRKEAQQKSRNAQQNALQELKKLHVREEENQRKIREIREEKGTLEKIFQEIQDKLPVLQQRCAQLQEISRLYDEFIEKEQELKQCRIQKQAYVRTVENSLHKIIYLKHQQTEKEQALHSIDNRKRQLEESWKSYAHYYKEETRFPVVEMDVEELESLFEGRRLAYERENADITDKKQLIDVYGQAAEKSLAAIRYRGLELEELGRLYADGKLTRTPIEQLVQEKGAVKKERDALEELARELADRQSQLDREEGGIQHAKASYEAKFGQYTPLDLQAERLKPFIKEKKEQMSALNEEEKSRAREQKELEKECYVLASMVDEVKHMMEACSVEAADCGGVWDAGAELREIFKKVRKDYERLEREEQNRRAEFERDKAKLQETLKLLGAYDLADEVGRSVLCPGNMADVKMYLDHISRTMECIRLEKERVGKSIENMEVIKDNFENRCLQTCSTIREALERLPGLSAIQLDGSTVQMIQMKIPYVRAEDCKGRMSAYIDEIVEQADAFTTVSERLNYIRRKLAWKRLFSVIVKDMDRIKLALYKRERMKEQSRYLKYEEAVGSTGQSQGIYIQFLVSVINYISSMHAQKTDAAVLKKVIFLDNPFGAAKDVYIWEPIFRLLAANHVQLIVPARGATPAITGRFAVNYVLGQKLVGGCQQTVVVDYRSEADSQQLEYKKLEFEQTELVF